jgi:hypothetical protein
MKSDGLRTMKANIFLRRWRAMRTQQIVGRVLPHSIQMKFLLIQQSNSKGQVAVCFTGMSQNGTIIPGRMNQFANIN